MEKVKIFYFDMKKQKFIKSFISAVIAITTIFVLGCSDDPNIGKESILDGDNYIGITSRPKVTEYATKGSITDTDNLTQMGVFAYTSTNTTSNSSDYTQKMFNAHYVKDGDLIFKPHDDEFDTENDFEWSEKFHHFFIYAPYDTQGVEFVSATDGTTPITSGFTSIKYTEKDNNPDYHNDLLYTVQRNTLRGASNVVSTDLKHALSKISFSVKNVGEPIKSVIDPTQDSVAVRITIDSIRLSNVAQSATMKYSTLQDGLASWSGHSDYGGYTINLGAGGMDYSADTREIDGSEARKVIGNDLPEDKDDNFLFLIPQNLYDNPSSVKLFYSYDPDGAGSAATESRERIIFFPSGSEWRMGSAYHYALNIDPINDYMWINAQLIDWGDTFDVISEVTYTYLHLEKAHYSLSYKEGERVKLNIHFSTNEIDENISISDNPFITDVPPTDATTTNAIYLNAANNVIECILYPDESYREDALTLKAGIVSTKLTMEFFPSRAIDFTSNVAVNELLGLDPSHPLVTSNSYILNPANDATMEFFIPLGEPFKRFAAETGGLTFLEDLDNWDVEVFAYDNLLSINRIEFEKLDAGYLPTTNGEPCVKVIMPEQYDNPGNIILAVKDAATERILWTWHLWITDYDPYSIITRESGTEQIKNSASENIYLRRTNAIGNIDRVHRYKELDWSYHMDRNIGALDQTFIGQGGLGGRGWLVYQYGRLAPIFGHQARNRDGTTYRARPSYSLSSTSQFEAISNPSLVYYNRDEIDWCSDAQTVGHIWNDKTTINSSALTDAQKRKDANDKRYVKSIFDPSPLGWMVPPLDEYATSGWDAKYDTTTNTQTYTSSSENVYHSSVDIDAKSGVSQVAMGSFSHIWSNTDNPTTPAKASYLRFNNYKTANNTFTVAVKTAPYTQGAPIRPIFQFYVPKE